MALINGTSWNDVLYGTASADTIQALGGDDTVYAGAGADYVSGSTGSDTLYGEDGNDDLRGGSENDYLMGGYGADYMYGDDGNDYIVSGVGSSWDGLVDTIYGGNGIDTWEVDFSGYGAAINIAIPASSATIVYTAYANFIGIEALVIGGSSYNDLIYGGAYIDQMYGWYGDDGLTGGGGDDYLFGEYGADSLLGNDGADTLYGGDGGDYLIGENGNDYLYGEAGVDTMQGINGADQMWGGTSNDVYLYYSLSDSTVTSGGRDRINDFAAGDVIDLSMLDANSGVAGNQAFAFAGGAAAYSVWAVTAGGVTSVFADVDGNATADFQIDLTNGYLAGSADFIL